MAHFAKLNADLNVLEVHSLHDNECPTEEFGISFLVAWSGGWPHWKQTSYNGSIRKNFAGVGYTYDETRDAFIPPKPFPSWLLNEQTCQWEAPVAIPDDGKAYVWNEQDQQWDEAAQ